MNQKPYMYLVLGAVGLLFIVGLVVAPGPVNNTVSEIDTGLGQFTERSSATPATPVPLVEGCGLAFTITPASKIVPPGAEITYSARLENRGTETCTNVSFSTYYSDAETFVSASPRPSSSNYYWVVGDLRSRETQEVSIRTRAGDERVVSEACATADNAADVCPQATVLVQSGATVAVSNSAVTPGNKEYGTWIWESPRAMSATYRESLLAEAALHGFDTVYVTIDDYLAIDRMASGAAKTTARAEYEAAVAAFVGSAKKHGLAVDLEGGARDWAEPGNRYKGYALLDFARAYNEGHPGARVRGFQYDVEPYLLSRYEGSKAAVLSEFAAFIDESVTRLEGSSVQFSVVIPHFYDAEQAWTPAFAFKGKTAHAYTHLLNSLERAPGSTVIIMAYRNFFDGEDGTAALVQPELQEASGTQTKVIVAQETGNVEPSYVTFYGMSQNEFAGAVKNILSEFANEQAFGGVAVHYLDSFLALRR